MGASELEYDGERFTTDIINDNTLEHYHRYAVACEFVKDKIVLDLACGEGYGSNLMSTYATKVIGVDLSQLTITHASKKYKKSNLEFLCGSATCTTLDDNSVDVVVSFETLEHLTEQKEMLSEIVRVLNTNGILIISSPDKKFYSDERGYTNKFHLKELYFNEFKELLKEYFLHQNYFLQRIVFGSMIYSENTKFGPFTFYNINNNDVEKKYELNSPLYNIAVCSNSPIPDLNNSIYDDMSVFHKIYNNIESALNGVLRSTTYKIGRLLLTPKRLFTTFVRKNGK